MTVAPVRCTAPHPDDPSRPCNFRLLDAAPDVAVRSSADYPGQSSIVVECRRCGTRYTVRVRAA